jgi:hypothetical protein
MVPTRNPAALIASVGEAPKVPMFRAAMMKP